MGSTRSDFLFSTPTFLIGIGSSVALAGNYYSFNQSRTPAEADLRAIASDFAVTGRDLWDAVRLAELQYRLNEQKVTEEETANG